MKLHFLLLSLLGFCSDKQEARNRHAHRDPQKAAAAAGKNRYTMCRKCRQRRADTVFLPCGHVIYCNPCSDMEQCGSCNRTILATIRTG